MRAEELFSSPKGRDMYDNILAFCKKYCMTECIARGVLVGLSGGADSVLLLIFLWKLKKDLNFSLSAMHINHMIRADSANRDEEFSKSICKALGIEFHCERCDVPRIAKERSIGIEECARDVRYSAFAHCIDSEAQLEYIATAHNASDNTETFIFNSMRGSGLNGLCGISPIRDKVIRPLLSISKNDIRELLDHSAIPYVTDETNAEDTYTRNYIRHNIIPMLTRITPNPDRSVMRTVSSLKRDNDYLCRIAKNSYDNAKLDAGSSREKLAKLDDAILARVIMLMAEDVGAPKPEQVHVEAIMSHLRLKNDYRIDIPGDFSFISSNGVCNIQKCAEIPKRTDEEWELKLGFNELEPLGIGILLSYDADEIISSNVYNFSMKAAVNSAIIIGKLTARCRRDGDKYRFGGLTRRVKRLFCDKKIPEAIRNRIPIVCDEYGILYIPGFRVRDGEAKDGAPKLWISVYNKKGLEFLDEGKH